MTMNTTAPSIEAIRNKVEWEKTQLHMPSPESLALMAGAQPTAPRYLCASDYGDTVETLRQKGYTWNEVQKWMATHGADFSAQAIIAGWRTWMRRRQAE